MRARLAILGAAVMVASLLVPTGSTGADPVPEPQPADTVPPVVTVPPDMTVPATSPTGALVTFTASAHDLVDGALIATCTPDSGSEFPGGETTVTCTATDAAGNTGSATFTVKVLTPCTTHCDCEQGSFCYKGTCLRDPRQAVYCSTKPGCPPGHMAMNPDGSKGTCPEDPNYVCGDACDCGPAHCCKYSAALGHNVCVKDTSDPWHPGGDAIGPPCQSGADATYCCGDHTCYAGRQAYGTDTTGFRCQNRATGAVESFCGGAPCLGTACNCASGETCIDTTGHAGFGSTCFLLGGGSCISEALAEAIYYVGPSDLLSCCTTGCRDGLHCEVGASGGCGTVGYRRVVGTCGSCGNGTCDPGEFPATCAGDCRCGDGACAPSEVGTCPVDCGTCGNGTCDPGESASTCQADCGGAGDGRCGLDEAWAEPGDCGCPDAAYYPQVFAICGDGVCSEAEALSPEAARTCSRDCGPALLSVYVNGRDANAAPGAYVATGATVAWTYVATNRAEPLGQVAVTHDQPGITPVLVSGDTANPGVLDRGETWTWQATGTAAAGPRTGLGTLTATATTDGTTVADTDAAHYTGVDAAELAVDLDQLVVSRRLGGATGRIARYFAPDLARDAVLVDGSLWIVGQTQARDFPAPGDAISAEDWDAFLAEVDADGSLSTARLLGPGTARAIAADAAGNLYVAGSFGLRKLDPSLAEVYAMPFGLEGLYGVAVDDAGRAWVAGNEDVGVARISADGSTVEVRQTGLGGLARAVVPAPGGGAYVAGETGVVRIEPDGDIDWRTGLGGTASAIALHDGAVYAVGETGATGRATGDAHDTTRGGEVDAFLAVVEPGGAVKYWTYLGGAAADAAYDVAVDAFGIAYVAGTTASADFPVADDAADRLFQGQGDAFLAKLRPAGTGSGDLLYATFLGGTDPGFTVYDGAVVDLPYLVPDRAFGVALASGGLAWVVGETGAPDLPVVGPSADAGFSDALVVGLEVPNRAPVARAGPDREVLLGETVLLDGSRSTDPDGVIVAYRWRLDGVVVDGATAQVVVRVAGSHTVTLEVTDDRGDVGTDIVVIRVLSTAEAVRALIDDVRALGLPSNVTGGLVAKLLDAAAALDRGKVRPAIGKLGDFINQVEALRGKRLTQAQADDLRAAAERILAILH